jgi:hypothetical protein
VCIPTGKLVIESLNYNEVSNKINMLHKSQRVSAIMGWATKSICYINLRESQ